MKLLHMHVMTRDGQLMKLLHMHVMHSEMHHHLTVAYNNILKG